MFAFNPLKSVTFWGSLIYAASQFAAAYPGLLSPTGQHAAAAVGVILTAFGLRNAVAKSAP